MSRGRQMRELVRAEARQEGEKRIGGGDFLNDNISFNHGCKLADPQARLKSNALLEEFMLNRERRRNMNQKLTDLDILCANLMKVGRTKPISISLNRNHYIKNRYMLCSYYIIELVDLMKQYGWLEFVIGYTDEKEPRFSRIWATEKLIAYFSEFPKVVIERVELVELRDQNHKKIEYKESSQTIRIRNILKCANDVNRDAKVSIERHRNSEEINTDLHTVFNNSDFKLGGRLYTSNLGYQNISGNDRKQILIDGQKTIELDYAGMQPRLLYALERIQYYDDPYLVVCENYHDLRQYSKGLLLALLHTDNETSAVSSGNYTLHKDHELRKMLKDRNISAKSLIERFKKEHPLIAHLFCDKIGLKLMNLDGKIALEVVENFTSRNIPILAIHDSFIVTIDKRDELEKVMQEAYYKHTGGFHCEIK